MYQEMLDAAPATLAKYSEPRRRRRLRNPARH